MYEFNLENPGSWRNFPAPYLETRIPRELLKIGGTNYKGQPRLRAVWGGKEQFYYEGDNEIDPGYYLKYHLCFHQREEIGKPRWIIEMWRDKGDCAGFFKEEGYYHLLTVQREPINEVTGMGKYRPIGTDVLETVKGMFQLMENTTAAQREAMQKADDEKAKEKRAKEKEEIWRD